MRRYLVQLLLGGLRSLASKKKNNFQLWRTDKKYIKAVMSLPCAGCGNWWDDICAHHKTGGGMGAKSPDWEVLPLCNSCHQDIHTSNYFGLRDKQEEIILKTRKELIKRGLIDDGEYPKEREYV